MLCIAEETPVSGPSSSTRFVCKVCGNAFDSRDILKEHQVEAHHPKRMVTVNDIIYGVFEGKINLPKTNAEIVQYVEENMDKHTLTADMIDVVRNMPDRQYFNEADLMYGTEQGLR